MAIAGLRGGDVGYCASKPGWTADELDLVEANEAFAAPTEAVPPLRSASRR
jgi:acetyl-CoA acetyltransferase